MGVVFCHIAFGAFSSGCRPDPSGAPDAGASAATAEPASASTEAALDPEVQKLIDAALACPFDKGDFADCAAVAAFASNDVAALSEPRAKETIWSMLANPDERIRVLAVKRLWTVSATSTTANDVSRLFTVMEREANQWVRDRLAQWLGRVDLERLGLVGRLRALAASKDTRMRASIASDALDFMGHSPPAVLELVGSLLQDEDHTVRQAAARALAATIRGPATNDDRDKDVRGTTCNLLRGVIDGPKPYDALSVASTLWQCDGLQARVLDAVDKASADPRELNGAGEAYAWALHLMCFDSQSTTEMRKRSYAIAKRIAGDKAVSGSFRAGAMAAMAACDPVLVKKDVAAFEKDGSRWVSDEAAKILGADAKPTQ